MSVKVETLGKNMAKLTVEVSAEEFEKALRDVYKVNKNNISIPGFRKGKVPYQLVEKMYGPEYFYEEAANLLINKEYDAAVKESELWVVSNPVINVEQIEKGKSFIFTAEVAVKPEVTLGEYKGIEVPKADLTVSEEEVTARIDEEREKNARQISVEDRAVENGDMVMLDFEGFVNGVAFDGGKGENYPLTIGSGAFIPGFEEQLVGAKIDEDVEVNVTFPEEYQAPELAGKAAMFKCRIHEIKVKELPELDDEFAQDVSEFDTVAEYREAVRKELEEKKAKEAKAQKEDAVLEKIVKNAQMDIPDPMVTTMAQRMVNQMKSKMEVQGLPFAQYLQFTGMTEKDLVEQTKAAALSRIQIRIVLEAVAKAENIEASEDKYWAELERMSENFGCSAEALEEMLDETEKEELKMDFAIEKAVELVTEAAKEV